MAKNSTKINWPVIILILTVAIGSFLRLYHINSNPPSLYSDEADLAFQAHLFNQCGTDYFGNRLPTHFHSYADWQTPLYIYTVSFFQSSFGVGELSTRLPAALFGILTIPLFFLLSRNLFNNTRISLITSILISLNPWHIHYSRIGFAVTAMLFFILLGLQLFFKFIKDNRPSTLLISFLAFVLSIYSYSTAKLFIPLLLLTLLFFYSKAIFSLSFRNLFFVFIISLITLTPLIIDTINGHSGYRFSYINIFSDPTTPQEVDRARYLDSIVSQGHQIGLKPSLISTLFHNKLVNIVNVFKSNYIQSFSFDFLFLKGDQNLRHGFAYLGYFYSFEIIFFLIGFATFLKSNLKNYLLVLSLLVLAPIPSALTNDSPTPHGTRLIIMLPFLIFFIASGLNYLLTLFPKYLFSLILIFFGVYSFVITYFFHYYFVHYPQVSARDWHAGMKEAVTIPLNSSFNRIFYSNFPEPFTPFFFLWNRQLFPGCDPPAKLLTYYHDQFFDGSTLNQKYFLGHLEWPNLTLQDTEGALFVVPQSEFPVISNQILSKFSSTKIRIHQYQQVKPDYSSANNYTLFNVDYEKN